MIPVITSENESWRSNCLEDDIADVAAMPMSAKPPQKRTKRVLAMTYLNHQHKEHGLQIK